MEALLLWLLGLALRPQRPAPRSRSERLKLEEGKGGVCHLCSGELAVLADRSGAISRQAPRSRQRETRCSVGTVGATNRTVVPMTVTVRIWLAHSHSPIRADASRSVDSIGTSGGVAWLREHERAKRNRDRERRCAKSGQALCSVFHFGLPFGFDECEIIPSLADVK